MKRVGSSFLQMPRVAILRFSLRCLLCFIVICGIFFFYAKHFSRGGVDTLVRVDEPALDEGRTFHLLIFSDSSEVMPQLLVLFSSQKFRETAARLPPSYPNWLSVRKPRKHDGTWDIWINGRRFDPHKERYVRIIVGSQRAIESDIRVESERYRMKFGKDFSGTLDDLISYVRSRDKSGKANSDSDGLTSD